MSGTPTLQRIAIVSQFEDAVVALDRLHTAYMGKAMSDEVYDRFARLRDDEIPALRAALASGATQPTKSAWDELPASTKAAIDRDAMLLAGVTMDQAIAAQQAERPVALDTSDIQQIGGRFYVRAGFGSREEAERADEWLMGIASGATQPSEPAMHHNFTTHRTSWRAAIATLANKDDSGYWPHELKAFDEAYATPPTGEPLTAPSEADQELLAIKRVIDSTPGMRGTFDGMNHDQRCPAAPTESDHATMLRLLDTAITHGHLPTWQAERRELVKQLKAKQ